MKKVDTTVPEVAHMPEDIEKQMMQDIRRPKPGLEGEDTVTASLRVIREKGIKASEMRNFDAGATRNKCEHKFDYDGFNASICDYSYAEYMHKHRFQADGTMRDGDNWQKGIPVEVYRKSMFRHMQDLRRYLDGQEVLDPDTDDPVDCIELLNAIEFNVKGMKYELLKVEG